MNEKNHKKQILSLWIPHLIAEAEKSSRVSSRPFIITSGYLPRDIIIDYDPQLEKLPIMKGLYVKDTASLREKALLYQVNYKRVTAVSHKVATMLTNFSPFVEKPDIENYYLDLTGTRKLFGREVDTAGTIIHLLKRKFSLTARAGIGSNVLIARIASHIAENYATYRIFSFSEKIFLDPLPIGLLPSLPHTIRHELSSYNITHIRDLRQFSQNDLALLFNRYGSILHSYARGIARTALHERKLQQILKKEIIPHAECNNDSILARKLFHGILELATEMRQAKILPRTYTLTVLYQDKYQTTRKGSFPSPTFLEKSLYRTLYPVFARILKRRTCVKKILLQFSSFIPALLQYSLFQDYTKDLRLALSFDSIQKRFGEKYIHYGT